MVCAPRGIAGLMTSHPKFLPNAPHLPNVNRMMKNILAVLIASAALAQTPTFQVASVKPFTGRAIDFRVLPGGRLHVTGLNLRFLIVQAYGLELNQVTGGPAWIDVDMYDIEATGQADATREQMMVMLQALLAERFELRVRRGTTQQNVYEPVVGKGGHKLKPPTGDRNFISLNRREPPTEPGLHYSLVGTKATLAQMAKRFGQQMRRPVIDKTGIEGEFDFKVDYAIDDNPESGPPLQTAIQEQLGLQLQTAKRLVETLSVEHAVKPSAN
jgi:uncharacterized protein (TIGR03435 family)